MRQHAAVARIVRRLALCLAVSLGAAGVADAQTRPSQGPQAPRGPRRAMELNVGGAFLGPVSFGKASADLLRSDGSRLTLFETENRSSPGYGVEASLAFQMRRSIWAEVTGGFTQADLRTRISGDAESVGAETVTANLRRFTVQGAALWYFRVRGRTGWFVRGGAGWMRELAGESTLVEDGIIGHGGIGLRHWWRDGTRGTVKRIGLRLEFRADLRSSGITLGKSGLRVGPAAAGHLVFGF